MEKQTIADKFPWAKEGAKAVIYSQSGWGYMGIRVVTITKVTKARITVSSGQVFYTGKYSDELRVLGADWYNSPVLLPTDDPQVAEARETIRQRNIENAAKGAAETFMKYRSVDNAHKAVAALLDYIEANKEEGK